MRFKSDLSRLILLLVLLRYTGTASLLNCDKQFTYYEDYGQNSFNVSCSGITKGYEHILENITINNEISLSISDSIFENITPEIFRNVRNIRMLNIFNSSLEFDKKFAIFEHLEKLETLIIRDTRFDIDEVTLSGLSNLKRLELTNNSLATIEKGGLRDLINLEYLQLIDNHVENVEDLQLCELQKLKILKLKNNLVSNLKQFYFSCLKRPRSLDLKINSQPSLPNIYHNAYYNVSASTFDLIELDLSFNQIIDLGFSLENLGKLRVLNLGYNRLVSVKSFHFKWLVRIQKIILTNNGIKSFDHGVFTNTPKLSYVDLSYNALSVFSMSDVPQLQYLDLRYNNMSSIFLKNLKRLLNLDLSFNKLTTLQPDSFEDVPNLISLNLAGNELDLTLSGFLKNIKNLKYLWLSNNSLNNIPEKAFTGLRNLKSLDLSFNNIKTLSANTFLGLDNLELLNLSANSIESLTFLTIEPLKNLRSLDIAANELIYIEYDVILSKLPGLSNINIKSNKLTCENLGKIIDFLKQRHIVYTNSENLDLDNLSQNVAGIPCRSATKNYLVAPKPKGSNNRILFNLGIVLIVVLASVLTGIISYRFYVYLKRRRYRADEFELVVDD